MTAPPTDAEGIADHIELRLLTQSGGRASIDGVRAATASGLQLSSARVDVALNVLARRSALLGAAYPFDVRDVGILRRTAFRQLPYTCLLAMSPSLASFSTDGSARAKAGVVLEDLTVLAMKALLGSQSEALRFAWPSSIGRPPEFNQAVAWLAEKMGIHVGSAYRPPRRKDGGVDVVAWRPFPDGRPGFPIYLVQATVERDYVAKSADVDTRLWSGWLALDSDPTVVLAIPGSVPPGEAWNEVSTRAILLDRIRLAGLLADQPMPEFAATFLAGCLDYAAERAEL